MITTEIPIKNYFFLLSYAWNMLRESESLKVNFEKCSTPNDLFARVLVNGLNILIKKGLSKNYSSVSNTTTYLKGKVLIADSMSHFLNHSGKVICEHDELDHNILENQIIFQTLRNLQGKNIDLSLKREIHKLLKLSKSISSIEIKQSHFGQLSKQRDSLRSLLLNLCEIVYLSSIPTYTTGEKIFRDFINDEKSLGKLFEAFIYNFYRSKLKQNYSISKDEIRWGLTPLDETSQAYLPKMRSDVVIQTKNVKIIIDTKFYKSTFQSFYEKETIHSGNLYQIQSYIQHDTSTGEPKDRIGILLYPTIKETPPLKFKYQDGNRLQVRTIDLGQDWEKIEESLLNLIIEITA